MDKIYSGREHSFCFAGSVLTGAKDSCGWVPDFYFCINALKRGGYPGQGMFFLHHLKQFIDRKILGYYSDRIEEYGWIDGKYVKLSDQIIEAIQTDVKEYISTLQNVNSDHAKQIQESRDLYYSKKLHGDRMLRNIQPEIVASKCKIYFMDFYDKLFTAVV